MMNFEALRALLGLNVYQCVYFDVILMFLHRFFQSCKLLSIYIQSETKTFIEHVMAWHAFLFLIGRPGAKGTHSFFLLVGVAQKARIPFSYWSNALQHALPDDCFSSHPVQVRNVKKRIFRIRWGGM